MQPLQLGRYGLLLYLDGKAVRDGEHLAVVDADGTMTGHVHVDHHGELWLVNGEGDRQTRVRLYHGMLAQRCAPRQRGRRAA